MWPLLQQLIDEVVVVSVAEVEAAKAGIERSVAIVSGGNLDRAELARILSART